MAKLLFIDLKRIVKDKLFLVSCIIGSVFAFITPLLYKLIFETLEIDNTGLMSSLFTPTSMFFQCFSLSNNFGIIMPVFILIILFKDFSFGTIRNKIISGNSRNKIYFSNLLATFIIISLLLFCHALITGILSLALFPSSANEINGEFIKYFALSLLFEILVLVFVSSLISFINVFAKNIGLSIILYVAVLLVSTIISSILSVGVQIYEFSTNVDENILNVLRFFLNINIFYTNTSIIGIVESYENYQIVYILLSTILFSGMFVGLSLLAFNKKDIK